jgi:hypothetical protein
MDVEQFGCHDLQQITGKKPNPKKIILRYSRDWLSWFHKLSGGAAFTSIFSLDGNQGQPEASALAGGGKK